MKALAGTGELVRLVLRRDRIILPIWIAVLALLPVAIANTLADLYPTAAERQSYLDIVSANPALSALYGNAYGSGLGALTAWRLGGTVLMVGLATLLTVIRHTRAEEVAGRRELLGATVVGRQAPLFAALVVAFGASLALGALVSVGLVAYGLPTTGSVAFGLSWTMFGWAFAAVAAVAAQVTESARVARGISIAVLGLSFVLRAAGDAGDKDGPSWLSPFGWAQRIRPFVDERWWVFLLFLGLITVLTFAALALSERRDLGSGLLPTRLGPAVASPWLRSPLALSWRLQRSTLLAWTAGFVVFGAILGSVGDIAVDVIKDNPQLRAVAEQLGGSSGLSDAYFAAVMGLLGLVVWYSCRAQAEKRGGKRACRARARCRRLPGAVGREPPDVRASGTSGRSGSGRARRRACLRAERRRRGPGDGARARGRPRTTARRLGASWGGGGPVRGAAPVHDVRGLGCSGDVRADRGVRPTAAAEQAGTRPLAVRPRPEAPWRRHLSGVAPVARVYRRWARHGWALGLPETRCPVIWGSVE